MHDQYRTALAEGLPDFTVRSFQYLGEGEDHIAFEVNSEIIFRFTKGDDDAALAREAAILRYIQDVSPLPTPIPIYVQIEQGFMGYKKLSGVPLIKVLHDFDLKQWPNFAKDIARFMSAINAAAIDPIKDYLEEDDDSLEEWRISARASFEKVQHLIPSQFQEAIKAFLDTRPEYPSFTPTFCHHDLGVEHILINMSARQITGIIDWGDVALGDPANDFGKLYRDLGPEALEAMLRHYETSSDIEVLRNRSLFFGKCGALEDMDYGLETGSTEYIDKSLAALSWLFTQD